MTLDVLIEALLFYKAAPQTKKRICALFGVSEEELAEAIKVLQSRLAAGATRLIETDTEVQLVTAPEVSEFVDSLRRQEMSGDIGKAGAETLAIVLYREPVTRAEIDRIRGVNSSFILRNLQTRGLVVREPAPGNSHQFRISPSLLQQLGVTNKHELPQFADFANAIEAFQNTEHE